MARDVRLEMNRRIRAALGGRLVTADAAGSVAQDLVRRLRTEDPALLAGWLQLHAAEALGAHIARRHPAPVRSRAARKTAEAQPVDAAA